MKYFPVYIDRTKKQHQENKKMDEIEKLVTQAINGDEAAFETLYSQSYRAVYFTCINLVKNEQDALDITQEVYISAYQHLSTLVDRSRFMPWITRIAVNKCKDYLKVKRPIPMDDETLDGFVVEENENFLPEEYINNQVKRQLVMDIMHSSLSDTLYSTVILYYFDGLSVTEVAEIMECPVGTVTYRLSVARGKIKAGVLEYEKKNNDRLYSFSAVPFLSALLAMEMQYAYIPYTSPAFLKHAANLSGNPEPSGNIPKGLEKGGKAIIKTVKGKLAAGVVATAVVAGGVVAVITVNNSSDEKRTDEKSVTEISEAIQTDTETEQNTLDYTETEETETATEETTEVVLADNELLCGNDWGGTPCTKVTINFPDTHGDYVVNDKMDHFIEYDFEENIEWIYVAFHNNKQEWIDEIIQNLYDSGCDYYTLDTGTITNNEGLEFDYINESASFVYSDTYTSTNYHLYFVAELPDQRTDDERECCIVIAIDAATSAGNEEIHVEDYMDLIDSSVIKLEKNE
jgi:RNA polymerase sigma factor (sigma-70 family)